MVPCSAFPLSTSLWNYNFDTGKLYSSGVVSAHFGTVCVVDRFNSSKTDGSRIGLGSCTKYEFRPLHFLHLHPDGASVNLKGRSFRSTSDSTSQASNLVAAMTTPSPSITTNSKNQSILIEAVYKCPVTSLPFPLRLREYNQSNYWRGYQSLAGVGHYSKVS